MADKYTDMMQKITCHLTLAMIFLTICFAFSCNSNQHNPAEEKAAKSLELMAVDRGFSDLSKTEGMKAAYIEYIDSNAVMLRANHLPFVGANAIDFLIQQNDADYVITWEPRHAEVAASGELGVTYGVYMLHPKGMDTAVYGTYTNVWKKQLDGKWKLFLNTSNEGVGK